MLEYEIQQYLTISLDQYVLQYKLLEEIQEEGGIRHKLQEAFNIPTEVVNKLNNVEAVGSINLTNFINIAGAYIRR